MKAINADDLTAVIVEDLPSIAPMLQSDKRHTVDSIVKALTSYTLDQLEDGNREEASKCIKVGEYLLCSTQDMSLQHALETHFVYGLHPEILLEREDLVLCPRLVESAERMRYNPWP